MLCWCPVVGINHNTAFMICAVAVTLATGGPGPAILASVLALVCTVTLFGDPGSLSALGGSGSGVTALLYGISCAVMIALGARHIRRSRREREAHARDLQMLDLVTDCFFVLDRQWRFTHINGPGLKYFNKQPQELLGQIIWDVFPMPVSRARSILCSGGGQLVAWPPAPKLLGPADIAVAGRAGRAQRGGPR